MKNIVSILILFYFTNLNILAQVKQINIVEHFTNTSCSVCASNNPNIFSSINNHPGTLLISFHPSSPYPSDFFNPQNKTENDDRTKYYGLYGSTPKLMLNGKSVQVNNLNSNLSIADTLKSNFILSIVQKQISANQLSVEFSVKKVANDTTTFAVLFVGAIEDTVYKTTNNGEKVHYMVFRKSLSNVQGNAILLPKNIGDSVLLNFQLNVQNDWILKRISTMAILQRPDKKVINSNISKNEFLTSTSIDANAISSCVIELFPNPNANGVFYSIAAIDVLDVYNVQGVLIKHLEHIPAQQAIFLNDVNSGMFAVRASVNGKVINQIIRIE